jgi:hypothetical protein
MLLTFTCFVDAYAVYMLPYAATRMVMQSSCTGDALDPPS